jgi:hypothetical protein
MSEVPHCPRCERADTVTPRNGSTYTWYCSNVPCFQGVIEQDDVRDVPFMRMCRSWDEEDIDSITEQNYHSDCECNWCERGRPRSDQ